MTRLWHWIGVVRRHPRPGRLIAAKLLTWTGLSRVMTLQLDGYRLRFYPSNATTNLWITADARSHDLTLFRDYCKNGDAIVDVGANVGEVTIIASQRVGTTGQVFAFEPSPRVFNYLLGNLRLNDCRNVTARNMALADAAGTRHLTDNRRDDMNRLVAHGGTAVACSTLDSEIPAQTSPALLKIDVEGTELSVLKGGVGLLRRTACVNCEMWASHFALYGYSMGELIAFLRDAGFETFVIDRAARLRRVDPAFAEDGGHELVAVRDVHGFIDRTGWSIAPVEGSA